MAWVDSNSNNRTYRDPKTNTWILRPVAFEECCFTLELPYGSIRPKCVAQFGGSSGTNRLVARQDANSPEVDESINSMVWNIEYKQEEEQGLLKMDQTEKQHNMDIGYDLSDFKPSCQLF